MAKMKKINNIKEKRRKNIKIGIISIKNVFLSKKLICFLFSLTKINGGVCRIEYKKIFY